ncbi:MAG: hypothetical protein P4L67_01045 [Candidatus Pacebacteria bacterium]|nr:hypothetical protein [Candidatus Paceibacterota bacterium]
MKMDVDQVRLVVNILSAMLLANLFLSWLFGRMKMSKTHIASHGSALALTIVTLLAVEFGLVPLIGRHFTVLLFLHYLCLCGAMWFGVRAVKWNPYRSPFHNRHGRKCLICWGTAIVLGLMLVN